MFWTKSQSVLQYPTDLNPQLIHTSDAASSWMTRMISQNMSCIASHSESYTRPCMTHLSNIFQMFLWDVSQALITYSSPARCHFKMILCKKPFCVYLRLYDNIGAALCFFRCIYDSGGVIEIQYGWR